MSTREEALVFSRDPVTGRLVNPHTVLGLGLAVGFTGDALVGGDYRTRVVDVPVGPGMTEVCSLAGLSPCAGSGSSSLPVRDGNPWVGVRTATAEILYAQPGATIVLFRSDEPASSPALGGQLCIDRRAAVIVGTPIQANAQGAGSFALRTVGTPFGELGFGASDHLQALVLGAAPELTNAMAWIP